MARNVLVVDDQQYIRILLKDNLEFDHFTTRCASKGRDALDLAEAAPPDLAIVDIGLPDISGWDVCRELRRRQPKLQIVLLSATPKEAARGKMEELGLVHFVAKPYDPISLSELVKRLLPRG